MNAQPQFLSLKEVATTAALCEKTIHRLVAKGVLRPAREGRKLLFPRAEVDAWIATKLAERPPVEAQAH